MTTKHLHPCCDTATWAVVQAAARRIHFRQNPSDQDRVMVKLFEAHESNFNQVKALTAKVKMLESQEPSACVMTESFKLMQRLAKS